MQFTQVLVGAEAARSEDNAARRSNAAKLALAGLHDDAEHVARSRRFADDFFNGHPRTHFNAEFLCGLRENRTVTLSLGQRRHVRARIERTEDLDDVVLKLHAEAFEPFDRRIGILAEHLDAVLLTAEVARSERLLGMVLPGILDALTRLSNGVGGIDEALRNQRIAARKGEFFENNDFLGARLSSLHGGSHAGAARTHDNHFEGFVPIRTRAFRLRETGRTSCGACCNAGTRKFENAAARKCLFVHLCSPKDSDGSKMKDERGEVRVRRALCARASCASSLERHFCANPYARNLTFVRLEKLQTSRCEKGRPKAATMRRANVRGRLFLFAEELVAQRVRHPFRAHRGALSYPWRGSRS